MIESARKLPADCTVEADLCIIGGGSAAIATAMGYLDCGRSVVILPGGGSNQTSFGIDLYRGKISPAATHEPLEENRLRMWGGTTTVWGGRCVPFDPIDFQVRSWMPDSGWPIGPGDIAPYWEPACRLSEAGSAEFDARKVFPSTQAEIIRGMDDEDLVSWPLERWSVPTDYARRYRKDLADARQVRVLMHSHALHLQLEPGGRNVRHVEAATSPDHRFRVKARQVVVACGSLENARLLLASNDVLKQGIGNTHDLVGRYYQSHRFGVCGYAILKNPLKDFIYEFEKDAEGVYCRRRFWLTPQAQEREHTCNVVGFFFRSATSNAEHRNAMVSCVLLVKMILGGARRGPRRLLEILRDQRKELIEHAGIVIKDGPGIFGQLAAVVYTRLFQKRRLPMVLPPLKVNRFPLFFQTEHAPNRDSRVVLDPDSRDAFGMPRLDVQIRFSEIDHHTCRVFVELFRKRLEASGAGSFHVAEHEWRRLLHPEEFDFNSNSHNIGTTRMAFTPDKGVVDPNCKVFGIDNLYMAGASVFPTSSHANPTLMIVALALRLADHLKGQAPGRANP
jgi:choline dehydrogenase-like flavoprotein